MSYEDCELFEGQNQIFILITPITVPGIEQAFNTEESHPKRELVLKYTHKAEIERLLKLPRINLVETTTFSFSNCGTGSFSSSFGTAYFLPVVGLFLWTMLYKK